MYVLLPCKKRMLKSEKKSKKWDHRYKGLFKFHDFMMVYKAIYYISWKYLWRNKERDRQREMRRKSALKIWMKCVIFQDISISKRARSFHLKVRSQSLKTKLEMNSRNLQPKDLWMNYVIIARALLSSHVSTYEVQIFKNKEITINHWKLSLCL